MYVPYGIQGNEICRQEKMENLKKNLQKETNPEKLKEIQETIRESEAFEYLP